MVALVFVEFLNLNNNREVKTKPKIAVINKMLFKRNFFIQIKVTTLNYRPVYHKSDRSMAVPLMIPRELFPVKTEKMVDKSYIKFGRWNIHDLNLSKSRY